MSDTDNAFVQATDNLIALYRSLERRTLNLPLFSVKPLLIFLWATLRFEFFLIVGLVLIIPTNLIIFIRNLFPGHWRYRPFFLHHLRYAWLWIWRGEAPTAPFLFIRPLLNVFMKGHFESRLRRLRLEILLNDGLSDATRSALLGRLDAALERWKSPRFAAVFFTVVLPGIISLPTWYQKFNEFMGSFGIRLPTDVAANLTSEGISTNLEILGLSSFGYLFAIPATAFLAKRGLFIGRDPDRICFPGAQEGSGAYLKEREILDSVGLRAREVPIDLWTTSIGYVVGILLLLFSWDQMIAWVESFNPEAESPESRMLIQIIVQSVLIVGMIFVAALRRTRTGRN